MSDPTTSLVDWLDQHPAREDAWVGPEHAWIEVVRDRRDLHWAIAHRKDAPVDVYAALIVSAEVRVRGRLAMRRNLPQHLLHVLATDPDEGVRLHVARNRKAGHDILQSLLNDEWHAVREEAAERLAELGEGS